MDSQRRIVLADDTKLFLKMERDFLQRDEIDISVAGNGLEAYKLISQQLPDLALLDLYMPVMNGDECCRMIKQNPELCHIPVIIVTAGEMHEQEQCRRAGCDDIILKPFNRQIFLETVQRFLRVVERGETRKTIRLKVMFRKDTVQLGFTVNLSSGGMFLETESPFPPGEVLMLRFSLPEQGVAMSCRARVSWINPPASPLDPELPAGMGLHFLDLDLGHQQQIRDLLKDLPG